MKIKTILTFAILTIYCASVLSMIKKDVAVIQTKNPVILAILQRDSEALKTALADKNPNFFDPDIEYTPLGLASLIGAESLVDQLLAAGAGPDFQTFDWQAKPRNQTALTHAALQGHESICTMLIKHGANINPKNPDNFSPLHAAARNGSTSIIEMLIGYGADLNAQTEAEHRTPLHETIPVMNAQRTEPDNDTTKYQACRILLQAQANPNLQTCFRAADGHTVPDKTPLMLAAMRNKMLHVHLLLLMGADDTIADHYGSLPLDHPNVRKHVAKIN